ncbi:MAG: hypothetical protein EOP44_01005 [Sphingobacteriaceae bacterium]|nr:MAG: hypothetical protein EOP44_01005 [Sphingobacteriaceae bacterium]
MVGNKHQVNKQITEVLLVVLYKLTLDIRSNIYKFEYINRQMNITIDIPESKAGELSSYAEKIGGRVITQKNKTETKETDNDEDEVTHGEYFGENIRRAISILRKK